MKAAAASVERALQTRVRQLRWAVIAAVLLVLGLAAAYMWLAWREIETAALDEAGLYSRVLEVQTNAALDSIAATVRTVGEALESARSGLNLTDVRSLMANAVKAQPALRSLSLLTADGRVLASTGPDNVGRRVDLALLGGMPAEPGETLGQWLPLRDLSELGVQPADVRRAAGISALPLRRRVDLVSTAPLLLVAMLNPESFTTQHHVLIGEAAERSALWSFEGQLLVPSGAVPMASGETSSRLAPFTRFLPAREHGSYVDTGMDGARSIGAFRTLRHWSVLVVVERPYAEIWTALLQRAKWVGVVALSAWLALGGTALLLLRGLRNQRRAQGALEILHGEVVRSEERWKLALEGAGDAVWDWDIARGTVHCSPRWQVLLGYDGDDEVREFTDWIGLAHVGDASRVRDALAGHLADAATVLHSEVRMRCGDGLFKWMLLRGMVTPQRDAAGRPLRLIGTLTNVHERHVAEAALAASQARRDAVLQSALDAIVTVDAQGRVIDFNPAAESMFGRTGASVDGQPIYDLVVAPAERAALLQRMAVFRATGKVSAMNSRLEVNAVRADGTLFPIELTVVPVQAGGQQLFTATMRDISERRWAERALRDSEARARATFEQAAVGVLQQGENRRFLRVNQTLCAMLGYDRAEFLALDADTLIHPEDVQQGKIEMKQLFAGDIAHFADEKRYRRKDGRYIWVRLTASLARDNEGRALYMIGIVEDIEEQRRTQKDLQAARRRELQIGARIQQSLLVTAPTVALPGVWLSSHNLASQEIDGDFFEVIRPGPHCIDLIAGDVMGKGVNAALMGAAVKMQFSRSLVELSMLDGQGAVTPQPAQILDAVHRAMTPHLQALDAFVTLCYLRIDMAHGRLCWAGCGHEEAMLARADGSTRLLTNQQPPLGVLTDTLFVQDEIGVQAGDALLLHSDGVSDALTPEGDRVGHARVHQLFKQLAQLHPSPGAVLTLLQQTLLQHCTMTDDVTLVSVRIGDAITSPIRLELPANPSSIAALRELVCRGLQRTGMDEVEGNLFTVAVVEAFTNIFRHGQGLVEGAPIEILLSRTTHELAVELIYVGERFEPPHEIAPTDFDAYPEGGFGLTIIQKACDRVDYGHRAGVNTMRMACWIESDVPVMENECLQC
ncbi:PAS domain S-box-containing protein [Variovorax sp. GrIS 2.14]|uniref:PAS domain S-box protein n=1 Tax=Variovorax sp. GrIS 2.14 TaxID=3071709 RepID=UPI0038F7DFE1